MTLSNPENPNYAATIVKIKSIVPLEGCDNVVGTPLLGFQAIVGKGTQVGDVGIVFTAETQLSEEFARENNLYRHENLNKDQSQKGYLEDNRRVRAMKFRGHRSDALFMPLDSLSYIGDMGLKEGDTFDEIDGHPICRKYVKKTNAPKNIQKQKEKFTRVDGKFLPEHYDTEQWFRNDHRIPETSDVIVTQKLHGTSIRIGHTIVARKLSWIERLARRLGVRVAETEFDYIFGSRKVIKDINNPNQNHFYGSFKVR